MESVVTDLGQPADLSENPEVLETQMNSRPMAVDEAIVELTDKNASFIVFLNSKTEEPNVLYRRNDGHYGLIHP
jgi:putative sigma-54 modulation protein